MSGRKKRLDGSGASNLPRRETRKVFYGDVAVGGDAPVSVQSMCTAPASDKARALEEISRLTAAGCEIVRVAVRDMDDAAGVGVLSGDSPIPVIADVHFDRRLAVAAIKAGAAGIRINPGNIGGREKVAEVISAAGEAGVPVRVGVNSGSLEKDLGELYSSDPARAMFESAMRSADMIESMGFSDLVFSLKSSDPMVTVEANRLFSAECDHPIHIGVTEAGPYLAGAARSAVALALLLSEGIGDTVRVSLSGDPVREVMAARAILSALGIRKDMPVVISCPTCGRCHIDVAGIAEELERRLPGTAAKTGLKVAVMGCEVNGPGEAREADIGIAGTKSGAVLFRGGEIIRNLQGDLLEDLLSEIEVLARADKAGRDKRG